MESRLIPAIVLVPGLLWSACNGGTENLGDGDGGSAGAELTSSATGKTQGSDDGDASGGTVTLGPTTGTANTGSGGNGSGGNGSGGNGSGGNGSGGNGNTGTLPDSGPIGNSGPVGGSTGAGGNVGAGGWGSVGTANGAGGNFGAGGGYSAVGSTTTGMGAGGSGGGSYYGATEIHWSSQVIPMLTHDSEQLYTGGSNLAAVALPNGPGTILNTATSGATVAVDATHLYVCSPGSLYRMSKQGGGTQNFQGAGVDASYNCTAVTVDDTTVSAVWFNPESHALRVRRWAKSDRAAPEDGLELDDLGEAYAPALIANGALYYANRTSDELLIGRILLDDYEDEPVLNVDAEFDSEYVEPLAVTQAAVYYQSCEQADRWCSLFSLPSDEEEPVPFEMYQRDSAIDSLAPLGAGVVVALSDGLYTLKTVETELSSLWTHYGYSGYGPLLMLEGSLYFVASYSGGSTLWRLPVSDE